jgi:flagellar motor switch protein FliN
MTDLNSFNLDQIGAMSDGDTGHTEAPRAISGGKNLDMLLDVMLQVVVELGRTRMPLRQVLELQQGSVVELERMAGDAVDVFVNERLIARGEVVVVDDKFGVRITELVMNKNGEA